MRAHTITGSLVLLLGVTAASATAGAVEMADLVTALQNDVAHKVRMQAAVILGRRGDLRAVPPLIEAMRDDEEPLVRAAAASALGELGAAEAIAALTRRLALDPHEVVRQSAGEALSRFDAALLHAALTKLYRAAAELPVRRQAVRRLGTLSGLEIEAILIDALGDEVDVFVEAKAVMLSRPVAEVLPWLRRAGSHRRAEIRLGAVRVLAAMATADAVKLLMAAYGRDVEVDEVRHEAEQALRQLRHWVALEPIIARARHDSHKHVRAQALKLLGVLGGGEARRVLLSSLEGSDIYVRGNAVMALGVLGDRSVIPVLARAAADPTNERIVHLIRRSIEKLKQAGPAAAD